MKKFLSLFAALLFAGSMMAADELLFSQTYPGTPSKFTHSYTSSFTMSDTLTYVNVNNGQQTDGWTSVRSGRKNNASVATITSVQLAEKISKVSVTFTSVNAGKTNELYLLVADNANFTDSTKIPATIATGEVAFEIASPAANLYYRIVIDQASHSGNGFNQFSAVSFYQFKEVALEDPVIAPSKGSFQGSVEVSFTCATEGAKVYYTLDGTVPTATSTEYTAAFTLTETTTVKYISVKGENISDVFTQEFVLYPTSMTCAEAATAALSVSANNELYADGLEFTVEGYVTDASAYKAGAYNSMFWMADTAGTAKILEAYKPEMIGEDSLKNGDKVRVTGQLTKYGTTPEFAAGCKFEILAPEPEYYLIGTMNSWKPAETDKFAKNEAAEGVDEYMLIADLENAAQFKVIGVVGTDTTWYPGGTDNNYVVNAAHAGEDKVIYFRPNYDGDAAWHASCIFVPENEEPVEGCDWEHIDFIANGSSVQAYTNQFKLCKQGAQPDVVNIQESFGTEAGIYVTFPSAEFGSISLPEGKYAIQGAGMLLYCSAFTLKETVVTVQCGGNDIVFTVYNVNGTEPQPEYYLKNNWDAGSDWTWKKMTKDEANYKLENVVFGGGGVNVNSKAEDEGSTWVPVADFEGDAIAAKDTVTLVYSPADGKIAATLVGKYVEPVVDPWVEIVFTKAEAVGAFNDSVFTVEGSEFSLKCIDTENSKHKTTANNASFGSLEDRHDYSFRLQTSGKSNNKNNMELNIPADGQLRIAVRTGSSADLTRTLVLAQGTDTIYNEVLLDTDTVEGASSPKIFNFVYADVKAGKVSVTYPINAINFYAFAFKEVVLADAPSAAPAEPTYERYQVKAVYSAKYNADCNFGEWESGTQYTPEEYGKKYVTNEKGYFGLEFGAKDCSEMEALHLDVWAAEDISFRVVPIHGGAEVGVTVQAQGQKWNAIDIALSEFTGVTNWSNVYQIKIDNAANLTFWLNNVYFYTTQTKTVDLADGYYCIGTKSDWDIHNLTAADKFEANVNTEGLYTLTTALTDGEAFKVVSIANNALVLWYPDGEGGNYVVDFFHSGSRTVYFRPNYDGGEGWHAGCILVDKTDNPYETWFATGDTWNEEKESHLDWDGANKKATVYIAVDKNGQWRAQVKYHGPVAEAGKCYHVALKMKANNAINNVTVKYQDNAEMVYVNDAALEANVEYVFDTIVAGVADGNGIMVLDFGFSKAGDTIEIYNVAIEEAECPVVEHTYTVAGSSAAAFGTTWDPANIANNMDLQEDGTYKWEKTDLELPAGEIAFKVVEDHDWNIAAYPAQDYKLAISESGIYTITITFNPESKEVAAEAEKTGEAVVIPTVAMHGNFTGSWVDTENFTIAEDNATATLKLNLTAGNYEFGMRIGGSGNWTANGVQFTRENNSGVVVAGQGNLKLAADVEGEYTFTWTYETNTLEITFPRTEGFENIDASTKAVKVLHNGQIFILRGDKVYTITGQPVK